MNLLFTGVGRRVELLQAFKTAATVLEKPTRIYGVDIDETAPALEFCDCVRKVPEMTDSGYIPQLLRICEKEQIDCLIPTIDTDLLALAEYKATFQAIGKMVLVSNPVLTIFKNMNQIDAIVDEKVKEEVVTFIRYWLEVLNGFVIEIGDKDNTCRCYRNYDSIWFHDYLL